MVDFNIFKREGVIKPKKVNVNVLTSLGLITSIMRELIGIILGFLLTVNLIGCSSKSINKDLEKGKIALNDNQYEQALQDFKVALRKESDNEDAAKLSEMVEAYLQAKTDYDKGNYEGAQVLLESIDGSYTQYGIKSDIDSLKAKVNSKLSN